MARKCYKHDLQPVCSKRKDLSNIDSVLVYYRLFCLRVLEISQYLLHFLWNNGKRYYELKFACQHFFLLFVQVFNPFFISLIIWNFPFYLLFISYMIHHRQNCPTWMLLVDQWLFWKRPMLCRNIISVSRYYSHLFSSNMKYLKC